jgi:hypothetical protein
LTTLLRSIRSINAVIDQAETAGQRPRVHHALSKPSADDPNEFMWSHRIEWAEPASV